jgi:uncharacterized protein
MGNSFAVKKSLIYNIKNNKNNDSYYLDTVCVGGGPSCLFASKYLITSNMKFIVIDNGKPIYHRDHNNNYDIVNGVGGAGLFSDGKFSFYPSGSELWNLDNDNLKKSYKLLKTFIKETLNEEIPDYPDISDDPTINSNDLKNDWNLKSYEVLYVDLSTRTKIISLLESHIRNNLLCNTEIINIEKVDNKNIFQKIKQKYKIMCIMKIGDVKKNIYIYADNIILGGGRFMPIFTQKIPFIKHEFKRVELGLRIEGKSNLPLYNASANTDPKFVKLKNNDDFEFKTFCWCRDGETSASSFKMNNQSEIQTWSGRSDIMPTGKSNFGFNLKTKNEKYYYLLEGAIKTPVFEVKLNSDDINDIPENYREIYDLMKNDLKEFVIRFGGNLDDFTIKGPTIEGVGYYPITDENMKVENENIWIIGDANGKYRGLIPSILSGIYTAQNINDTKIENKI